MDLLDGILVAIGVVAIDVVAVGEWWRLCLLELEAFAFLYQRAVDPADYPGDSGEH
ncbi:MAG: hypothetical protein MK312_09800 [Roseibacillus sp.]|nr:hypothetical protein [Roseibacillus sp.]